MRVTTASAEAAEEDPVFAAAAVKAQAGALYVDVQRAWSERDDESLARLLGPDLLVEWCRRLADFAARGWVNEVAIRGGPQVGYVGLVNREGEVDDRVTVTMTAKLHSVVRTSAGAVVPNKADTNGDGVIDVCEYWTLDRAGDRWRLIAIEQEREGAHHLDAADRDGALVRRLAGSPTSRSSSSRRPMRRRPAFARPSSSASRSTAPRASRRSTSALADPRCAPDLLEVAARRAVEAWAEAVDGDDSALLAVGYAGRAAGAAVSGPERGGRARRRARAAAAAARDHGTARRCSEPLQMEVEARVRGRRYVEDRDTAAVVSGSKQREIGVHRALDVHARRPDRGAVATREQAPATTRASGACT